MDEMLILLLRKGAHQRPVRLTTSEIGTEAGMSQQNASRRLSELERTGYISRGRDGISLTPRATQELSSLHASLRSAFEGKLEMRGRIVKGLGEGRFYLSLAGYRKAIKETLGFVPFPGTLNIEIDSKHMAARQQLRRMEPFVIHGFKDKERVYGDLFAYRCSIDSLECAIIIPLRTHHGPDLIEIIWPPQHQGALGKKDGDIARVIV